VEKERDICRIYVSARGQENKWDEEFETGSQINTSPGGTHRLVGFEVEVKIEIRKN